MKTRKPLFLKTALALAAVAALSQPLPMATAAAPAPEAAKEKSKIEVCFVLDTTGSMTGLIEGAKQKIWSIANQMLKARPAPDIRIGLIGYRDRGDEYITRTYDLTNDIDAVYSHLQSFHAAGGGDLPESVNEALQEAVQKMSWSADKKPLKIIFLVGDAPPHMDYANGPKYPQVCQEAVKKDLIINTVQCGSISETTPVWKEIAQLSEGNYMAVAQSGNMAVIATPMDSELASLNRELGTTLVAYGGVAARRNIAAKQAASESAPAAVAAERLSFNVRSGVAVQGDGELLDGLSKGTVKAEAIEKDKLPEDLRRLDSKALAVELEKKQKQRSELQDRIRKLGQQREKFLQEEQARLAARGAGDSFDEKVADAIRAQAGRKGIAYEK